ncbi:hypothetical protein [Saccharibacillus alkalitolerans]|uniref:Uncharacterized protein n=1 Tax=Saccharibacillus alkalitolerans TaxID=2705290 RepID=A0ABX0F3Z2_9BACL|nr:hypothetical protein [Saccharibacillus alkalitolerans]NGZ73916.1 hypothetical protein [Saccharibacillus alkalitolerans]
MSRENPRQDRNHQQQEGIILVRELRTILLFTLGSVAVVVGLSFFL